MKKNDKILCSATLHDIVSHIKANYHTITKELREVTPFTQYSVRSRIDNFDIEYDFDSYSQTDGNRYDIPFTVTDKNGDKITDTLYFTPPEDSAGVILSFDDNFFDNWSRYFESSAARVTFFVRIYDYDNEYERPRVRIRGYYRVRSWFQRYCHPVYKHVNSWFRSRNYSRHDDLFANARKFALHAQANGHEIGFHTVNHPNLTLIANDLDEFDDETVAGMEHFKEGTCLSIKAFAYPYGYCNDWTNERLSQTYKVLRGCDDTFCVYNKETLFDKHGFIGSKNIDWARYEDIEKFRSDIRKMLLITKFMGGIVPLTTHNIVDDLGGWSITPDNLTYVIETANGLKLKFYTYRDFYDNIAVSQGGVN